MACACAIDSDSHGLLFIDKQHFETVYCLYPQGSNGPSGARGTAGPPGAQVRQGFDVN